MGKRIKGKPFKASVTHQPFSNITEKPKQIALQIVHCKIQFVWHTPFSTFNEPERCKLQNRNYK